MNELGLGPLNDHVVRALQQHSRRNRDGFKLEFHKQFPVTFRDSNISGMLDGDASWRRLSVPLRMIDRVNARLHGDRFLETEVPLLLRNYGSTDPAALNRQRTLVHRAILLSEFEEAGIAAYRHLFSPVLVSINNPAGKHIGLIQYDRTHNGEFGMYQLMEAPSSNCRVKQLLASGEGAIRTISVSDAVREELAFVYSALRRYFSPACPPERSLCLAQTADGYDVILFNLAQLQIHPGFEMMETALLADYEVPTVEMTFAVNELFQPHAPYWNAAAAALHTAEYGVYLNQSPGLAALEASMKYRDDVGHISPAECRQILGILLDNGLLRKRGDDAYEADPNPEILRVAIAQAHLSWEELFSEEERPYAQAVLAYLAERDRRKVITGHFDLLQKKGKLSEERANAVLAKLEGAAYIRRIEPVPGEVYFRKLHANRPEPVV